MMIHLMGTDFLNTDTGCIEAVLQCRDNQPEPEKCDPKPVSKPFKKRSSKSRRQSEIVKKWRLEVLKRDKYTCQSCGVKENLQVHHHARFSKIDILSHSFIFNGITLCTSCHADKHPEFSAGCKKALGKYKTRPSK